MENDLKNNIEKDFKFSENSFFEKEWVKIVSAVLIFVVIIGIGYFMFLREGKDVIVSVKNETDNKGEKEVEEIVKEKVIRNGTIILKEEFCILDLKIGDKYEVEIVIDTQESNITVGSIVVNYDSEILKLINIDEEESVLTMGVIKNNKEGKIEIVRSSPGDTDYNDNDDGFTGSGKFVSLEFEVLENNKELNINFNEENTKLILDDGSGTEMILEYVKEKIKI